MSDEDVWRPAAAALEGETNPLKRAFRDFYAEHGIESVVNALRRAARLEVDREMTLKVLQLRLSRDASKEGTWPGKLVDPSSAVCPAASYLYEAAAAGVELRFQGDVPTNGPVLPLTFRGRNPEPDTHRRAASLDSHPRGRDDRSAMTRSGPAELVVAGGNPVGRSRALPTTIGRGMIQRDKETPGPKGSGVFDFDGQSAADTGVHRIARAEGRGGRRTPGRARFRRPPTRSSSAWTSPSGPCRRRPSSRSIRVP